MALDSNGHGDAGCRAYRNPGSTRVPGAGRANQDSRLVLADPHADQDSRPALADPHADQDSRPAFCDPHGRRHRDDNPAGPRRLARRAPHVDQREQRRGRCAGAGLVARARARPSAHADDCAQRGWGSHVGSDGAQLRTRLARAGYQATWLGENWANSRTVQQTFDAWWDEPPGDDPHRRNILEPNYREIGIGVAAGGYGYFFIADFGRED